MNTLIKAPLTGTFALDQCDGDVDGGDVDDDDDADDMVAQGFDLADCRYSWTGNGFKSFE